MRKHEDGLLSPRRAKHQAKNWVASQVSAAPSLNNPYAAGLPHGPVPWLGIAAHRALESRGDMLMNDASILSQIQKMRKNTVTPAENDAYIQSHLHSSQRTVRSKGAASCPSGSMGGRMPASTKLSGLPYLAARAGGGRTRCCRGHASPSPRARSVRKHPEHSHKTS